MAKIIQHPLIDIKLTKMRDQNSDHTIFRKNLNEIASLMVYEILRDYETSMVEVTTPIAQKVKGSDFKKEIVIVPILRAGLGMVEGILSLVPQARIGHIGIYRDEISYEAHEYFYKLPKVAKDSEIILVDPMLATGNSAVDAISALKKDGFTNIRLVCLVGVQEGINNVETNHCDVKLYLACQDSMLNAQKYIVPGLGDAGDRLFGTK